MLEENQATHPTGLGNAGGVLERGGKAVHLLE